MKEGVDIMRWQRFLVAVVVAGSAGAAHAGDPGSSGALFLRVGFGARASAMGEAQTAVAEDATTIYWNPGAMAAVLGTNVTLAHNEYFESLRLEQAAVVHETDWGTIGFMFTGLYMDEMDRREDAPSANPLGTFGAYDVAVAIAYARYIVPNLTAGISVKPVYERIDELSASGIAFDIGLYHVARITGVKFAAVVGNVGPPMKFDEEEFALPQYFKLGGSYEREIPALEGRILATFDANFPNDGDPSGRVGGEYSYRRLLALRAGYKALFLPSESGEVNSSAQGATFGVGVRWHEVALDYAFLPSDVLGDNHRFGLGFSF
jgi:hypothetical protein